VDGAIIVLDLILGVERMFLEKHPAEITTLAFWEDKSLISGSIDGRVNVADLESDEKKILRC
jgi:WD40 repeat protein